jgi:hypothetical protein
MDRDVRGPGHASRFSECLRRVSLEFRIVCPWSRDMSAGVVARFVGRNTRIERACSPLSTKVFFSPCTTPSMGLSVFQLRSSPDAQRRNKCLNKRCLIDVTCSFRAGIRKNTRVGFIDPIITFPTHTRFFPPQMTSSSKF